MLWIIIVLEYVSSAKLLSDGICAFSQEFFVISLISESPAFYHCL